MRDHTTKPLVYPKESLTPNHHTAYPINPIHLPLFKPTNTPSNSLTTASQTHSPPSNSSSSISEHKFPLPTTHCPYIHTQPTSVTQPYSHALYHSAPINPLYNKPTPRLTLPSTPPPLFDNYGFKTAFNEELYNTIVKNKKVIAECCFDLDDDEYPEIREQIALRGWRRLAAPKPEISIDLIHEFYANAIITEEEMEEHGGHTHRSFVRGVPIDFSPENIQNVMWFRAQVQGATTDFETRKEHDQQLDRVLANLCMPGAT
ncbi:hypothetical protein PIB30_090784 [Stylosanthes scabra]|uniref:Putative plant transposon protein domain-containing protein n=1 Tax=Stylosanthes scabra TaxID=79078 RepID=A0ABU6VW80_9FABA|nr:hypothetical protein [Stylosanthes scabra]